ncbi:MAG: 30S ribosomal protein S17 [Chloroflexota bacterium]|nr:30S ribosomal protein S17 [Chloroflexota bacterium]
MAEQQEQREQGRRQIKTGQVVSDKMDKTIVVSVSYLKRHPIYHKTVRRSSRFKAHDERNEAKTGDTVRIIESRPLSKEKRWRLLNIVQKAE